MMNKNNYAVIMAGGIGSRFWPMSKSSFPKQFLDILGTARSNPPDLGAYESVIFDN